MDVSILSKNYGIFFFSFDNPGGRFISFEIKKMEAPMFMKEKLCRKGQHEKKIKAINAADEAAVPYTSYIAGLSSGPGAFFTHGILGCPFATFSQARIASSDAELRSTTSLRL